MRAVGRAMARFVCSCCEGFMAITKKAATARALLAWETRRSNLRSERAKKAWLTRRRNASGK